MTEPIALGITVAIETPLYALLGAGTGGRRNRTRLAVAGAAIVLNVLTHPLLWFALQPALGVWVAEGAVVAIEAAAIAWFLGVDARMALALSVVANGTSFATGLLVHLQT
jgi:hypothetical protein